MPFISVKTTRKITTEQETALVSRFGSALPLIGKSEAHLMLDFDDNCRMYFAGKNDEPSVFVDVALLGKASRGAYNMLTKQLCDDISEVLGINSGCIYVKYEEAETWGMNGSNF